MEKGSGRQLLSRHGGIVHSPAWKTGQVDRERTVLGEACGPASALACLPGSKAKGLVGLVLSLTPAVV